MRHDRHRRRRARRARDLTSVWFTGKAFTWPPEGTVDAGPSYTVRVISVTTPLK